MSSVDYKGLFSNELLIHEQMLMNTYIRGPISKNQFLKRFNELGDATEKILDREVNKGYLRVYEEKGVTMLEITEKGREVLRFALGLEGISKYPELYGVGNVKVTPQVA
jgi:predicted transcriptional regulator